MNIFKQYNYFSENIDHLVLYYCLWKVNIHPKMKLNREMKDKYA